MDENSGAAIGAATPPAEVAPIPAPSSPTQPTTPTTPVMLPMALSPSRAGDFMTCPLLYRFRVIDKLPERKSAAAARGTLVHAVLEHLFDLPGGQRTPTTAAALLGPQWDRLVAEDPDLKALADEATGGPEGWLAGAVDLLERYFRLEDPNRLEPAERELFVHTRIGDDGLLLRGFVDRVDIAPNGAIRIVDYKTGRAPRPAFEGKALFQMKFYALVMWKTRGVLPTRLQLIYLGDSQIVTYDPDEADLRATERKVAALWTAIRTAVERGQWPANPSKLCSWCDHQALCPSYGGTPPPLPVVQLVEASDQAPGMRGREKQEAEKE